MIACPNYNSIDWKNLVRHFKNSGLSTKKAELEATRVFLAHGSNMPRVNNLTDLKKNIKFQAKGISSLKKSMMLVSLSQYNKKNNSSHNIVFKPSTPTSYTAKLNLNFMPSQLTGSMPIDMNKKVGSYSNTSISTLESPDVYIGGNNEYVVNGEIFPSYEDAQNSLMYQKRSQSNHGANSELNNYLIEYLSKFGIKVEYIDNFMEKHNIDAVAVSDMASKMISVAKGKEDVTTLPEESAHFIIELMGENHSLYKAMDSIIEETAEYKEVVDEYSDTYNGDRKMLRKEAIGKIFANYIIKRYDNKKALSVKQLNVLGKIFNWFKDKFSRFSSSEIEARKEAIFSEAANKLFNEELNLKSLNLTGNKSVFAQTDKLLNSINKSIEKLSRKAKILREVGVRGDNQGRAEELASDISSAVISMKARVESQEYARAVAIYLEFITANDLDHNIKSMNEYLEDPTSLDFSATQINEMLDLVAMYKDTVSDLKSIISEEYKDIYAANIPNTDISIKDMFKETFTKITDVETFANSMHRKKTAEIIEQIKHKDSKYDVKEILDSAIGDLSFLQLNFGSLRNAPDEALRMIYRMVSDIYNETHYETLDRGLKLRDLQLSMEKTGVEMKEIHETYNGKKTGFMISKENWGEYYEEQYKSRNNAAKKAGFEDHQSMITSDPTADQWKIYNDEYTRIFRRKFERQVSLESKEWYPSPRKNPKFDQLMKNKHFAEYYNEMKSMMSDARDMLPSKYGEGKKNKLMLAQMRKDIMQTLKDKDEPLLRGIGSRIKESILVDEEDTEFGTTALGNSGVMRDANGKIAKLVPIHYVSKLSNPNQLSNDITSMTVKFYEMASNFSNISKDIDKLLIIQRSIGSRTVENGKKGGDGIESNAYKALDQFMDSFVYGKYKDSWEIKVGKTGKKVNATKVVDKIISFVTGNNLFMNLPVIFSGAAKASTDFKVDQLTNNYTTVESGLWAEKEFDINLPHIIANIGKRKKSGKASLMFEYNGIFSEISETFNRLDMKTRAGRATQSDLIYSSYALADVRIKGKLALSVYNNYRLVDGKFITKRQFDRKYKKSDKKWSDYKDKTLYDAYEIKNGNFVVKKEYSKIVDNKLRNTVRNVIKQRGAAIDGRVGHLDRPPIAKTLMGRAILMHRGWLVSGLSERWKVKGINYETDEVEEGYNRSFYNVVGMMISEKGGIKQKLGMWNELDDYQKHNTRKKVLDLATAALFFGMMSIMNAISDDSDDDDWWTQYLAFQMTRIYLEQAALMSPKEATNLLNSPTALTSLTDTVGSFMKLASDWDKIEYGAYEDMYRIQKAMIKNSLLKNVWELQAPRQKNKFLRSQIM